MIGLSEASVAACVRPELAEDFAAKAASVFVDDARPETRRELGRWKVLSIPLLLLGPISIAYLHFRSSSAQVE